MNITITAEGNKYLGNKENVSGLWIDIKQIDERCTRIYNPTIDLLKDGKIPETSQSEIKIESPYKVYISKRFTDIYGNLDDLKIDVGGFLEKILIISNIEAKKKNICKV